MSKDSIVNGYKILHDKLEEKYLDLTVRQLKALEVELENVWNILQPRGGDRRAKHG